MRFVFCLALTFLLVAGCDGTGPVGAVDLENGVRAEVTSQGIVVENQKAGPIHVVVYGERALAEVGPRPQTLDAPGRYVGIGLTTMFGFDDDGFVRRSDGRYAVYWITVKGEGADRHIGERGTLELAR